YVRSPLEEAHPSALLHRRAQIERHEAEQFVVSHLGQDQVRPAAQKIAGQLLLCLDHLVDLLLDGAATNELVHQDILSLPDSEGPVSSLVFHSRIPPSVEMNNVGGGGQIEPGASRLDREHEERNIVILL